MFMYDKQCTYMDYYAWIMCAELQINVDDMQNGGQYDALLVVALFVVFDIRLSQELRIDDVNVKCSN